MTELMNDLVQRVAIAWHCRRTEDGGLTDDVALMAMLVAVAGLAVAIIWGLMEGALSGLDFSFDG